jgi:alpha-N-arabinofuranosidase
VERLRNDAHGARSTRTVEGIGPRLPLPWEPLVSDQGNRYEPRWGDAANSSRSLEIMALPTGETGIRHRIYLPVKRTLEYDGSIWIRHLSGPAELSISIRERNEDDRILAEAKGTRAAPIGRGTPFI